MKIIISMLSVCLLAGCAVNSARDEQKLTRDVAKDGDPDQDPTTKGFMDRFKVSVRPERSVFQDQKFACHGLSAVKDNVTTDDFSLKIKNDDEVYEIDSKNKTFDDIKLSLVPALSPRQLFATLRAPHHFLSIRQFSPTVLIMEYSAPKFFYDGNGTLTFTADGPAPITEGVTGAVVHAYYYCTRD